MRHAALMTLVLLLAGCAAMRGSADAARDSWRGATFVEVVSRWGAPSRSTTLTDGRPAHTWFSHATYTRGRFYPRIGIFGSNDGIGVGTSVTAGPSSAEHVHCERTLVFSLQRVVEQHWMGSSDYCKEFRRN